MGHSQGPKQPVSKLLLGPRSYSLTSEESACAALSPVPNTANPTSMNEIPTEIFIAAPPCCGTGRGGTSTSIEIPASISSMIAGILGGARRMRFESTEGARRSAALPCGGRRVPARGGRRPEAFVPAPAHVVRSGRERLTDREGDQPAAGIVDRETLCGFLRQSDPDVGSRVERIRPFLRQVICGGHARRFD